MRTIHKFTETEVKEILRKEKKIPMGDEIEIEKDTIPWGKLTSPYPSYQPPYTITCSNNIPHCVGIREGT